MLIRIQILVAERTFSMFYVSIFISIFIYCLRFSVSQRNYILVRVNPHLDHHSCDSKTFKRLTMTDFLIFSLS